MNMGTNQFVPAVATVNIPAFPAPPDISSKLIIINNNTTNTSIVNTCIISGSLSAFYIISFILLIFFKDKHNYHFCLSVFIGIIWFIVNLAIKSQNLTILFINSLTVFLVLIMPNWAIANKNKDDEDTSYTTKQRVIQGLLVLFAVIASFAIQYTTLAGDEITYYSSGSYLVCLFIALCIFMIAQNKLIQYASNNKTENESNE